MSLPNLSELSTMQRVLDAVPQDVVHNILQIAGEELGAKHMCPFVEQECARHAPWLDCTQDATWRWLAIDIFGGPNASVPTIDRWKREAPYYEYNYGNWPKTWKQVFSELCHIYGVMYRAFRYNNTPPGGWGFDAFMLGVFPRFYEFPNFRVRPRIVKYMGTDVRRLRLAWD